ncbi:MAG: glycosyltransferase family 2 protein [Lentisphaeria bacterium]|jgi:B-glycosyltransferase, glycosyltransferase family 2 protein|nr:glycosyltransferase family 2 protein [Lentisphaeria bacterium]
MKLSVVIPVYMGEPFLEELYTRIRQSAERLTPDWELILVNDASPDGSWRNIVKLAERDTRVIGLNLSRNFGQHYAITAGLSAVSGDWVVVMDCDLQDMPEEIPVLYAKAQEGFDSVFARRVERQDNWVKKGCSRLFYQVFSFLTGTHMDASIANFGIYHRKVIEAILSLGDSIRFFPAMAQWVGFRQAACPVRHATRAAGESSYSWRKLFQLALDNMIAFSDKPLRITAWSGLCISILAVLVTLFYLCLALSGSIKVMGYASLILSIWFNTGIMLMTIGMVGIYVGKTFSQTKRRPTFIVADALNLPEKRG